MDSHPSPWNETWDAVVAGTGLAGLAAAAECSRHGLRCLLLGPDGDLAWEWGRAFAGDAGAPGSEGGPWWTAWQELMAARGAPAGDPAHGELAAHALIAADPRCAWLGYAPLVAVEHDGGLLAAVIVATRGGLRRIRARRWIDADGLLARLLDAPPPIVREWHQHWRVRHGAWPAEPAAPTLPAGLHGRWRPGIGADERRLEVTGPAPWALAVAVPEVLAALRTALPADCADAEVLAVGTRCVPVRDGVQPSPAPNVVSALGAGADAAAWCRAGTTAATRACTGPVATRWADAAPVLPPVTRVVDCAVLVAGWGTAGALAALTAAEGGADVLVCDPAWTPGGIGTAGLVHGYCAGAGGGRFEELDAAARALPFQPAGWKGNGWHPQAKAAVLAAHLAAAGVRTLPGSVVVAAEVVDHRVRAVTLATPEGLLRVRCAAAIDATGDGDLGVLAGADWRSGRVSDGGVLAYTQSAWVAHRDGYLHGTNCDCGWVDPTDSADLSRARSAGLLLFAGSAVGGRLLHFAPALGVRQSRHLMCDAEVTLGDLAAHRRHADAIGPTASFLDTHASDQYAEDDEVVVWQLLCRAFRAPLGGDLPYGMLLPRGLDNLWIACRAAGISPSASYALRMQRDMQRLGEVAGTAAALAVRAGCTSRAVDRIALRARLAASGACPLSSGEVPTEVAALDAALAALDRGEESAALWPLYAGRHRTLLHERLAHPGRTGWLAAALLAAIGDPAGEPRLLAVITARTVGSPPTHGQRGAFGQCIVLPDWALAAALLRAGGTAACLPALAGLAVGDPPFDLRWLLLLTIERLAVRLAGDSVAADRLIDLADRLAAIAPQAARLPASRNVYRRLLGEPDPPAAHVHHDGTEDLGWQLDVVRGRIRRALGQPVALAFVADQRAAVRQQAMQVS